ncbi:MAG: ATP-dependent helicase HrpB [Proteobacteria bacterium]|nr:ATP-dependent helicase HrpB [Pseudomonadota bacterium]
MPADDSPLPVDTALPALAAALRAGNCAVLVAPPGAGKTTRVPLVLAREEWTQGGSILVLEPRRLAARAAAARMAATLGEPIGETVGYRVRFDARVSRRTRIEAVTTGIFTRRLIEDPELAGVAAVLFDEFHERALDADLGLALARDAQAGLREDLRILVMSATIDGARVARLLGGAPVVEAQGRAFPVVTHYLGRDARAGIEAQVADAVARALRAQTGSILAFLPGAAEIRRTQALLKERIADAATDVVALFGALDAATQDRAIAPAPAGRRKVVLATSIAETSLTIEGVNVVVDSGLARVPRYEPQSGLTRLETVRVSRAAADQRRGRAGRTGPGVCYRMWDAAQTAALEPQARPEILASELSGLLLDLAQWGMSDPGKLAFLDAPPAAALSEARALLADIGALDTHGRITPTGRRLRALPLPPRLARMLADAAALGCAQLAARIALIVSERGLGGDDPDLAQRLDALGRERSRAAAEARRMAQGWAEELAGGASDAGEVSVGAILALAYPDRIARNRGTGDGGFLLANGSGARLDPASALAREPFIAVAELTGSAAQGRILLAAAIAPAEIEAHFAERIVARARTAFDPASASLRASEGRFLGAIALAERRVAVAPSDENSDLLALGIARLGSARLPWTKPLRQWRDRVEFLRRMAAEQADGASAAGETGGEQWPDLSDAALARDAPAWLAPALRGKTALAQLDGEEFAAALMAQLPWTLRAQLERDAPTHFAAPTGSRVAIDYAAEAGPTIAIRVQELFGLSRHPAIAGGRVALVVELLSPANRPVQVTRDLPGFWRGSYAAVKAQMRGRYPRHPWPDDPLTTPPTRRAKPRGT